MQLREKHLTFSFAALAVANLATHAAAVPVTNSHQPGTKWRILEYVRLACLGLIKSSF